MRLALAKTFCMGVFALALGCTQGTPSISATEELPPIILDQNFFESTKLDLYDVTISGRVTKFVNSLEVSFDGGNSWSALENTQQSSLQIDLASCSTNCQFSYAVNNIGQKWPILMLLPTENEAQGLLRGSSLYGTTLPVPFKIKRLKRGFVAVGSIGLNRIGAKAKTLNSGFKVLGGKMEAQVARDLPLASGSAGVNLKSQGVVQ